ncbi:hypothetical protein C8R44DRAFT_736512 [Mycena epipterygia]|nr:hypothetical protein C8R44DRAFT_736512 [Mycena epipterygia]
MCRIWVIARRRQQARERSLITGYIDTNNRRRRTRKGLKAVLKCDAEGDGEGLATDAIPNTAQTALANLIRITRDVVQRDVGEEVWIVTALAQRASAQVKINALSRYWHSFASGTRFLEATLEDCLATVHEEITRGWNFNDAYDGRRSKSWHNCHNLAQIQTLVGLGTTMAAAVGPAIAGIGLSVLLIRWIGDNYGTSDAVKVHREIRSYADEATFVQIFQSNKAEEKAQALPTLVGRGRPTS